jgi:ribonuclease D
MNYSKQTIARNKFPPTLSKEQINSLPLGGFKGRINIVTPSTAASACADLKATARIADEMVVGFDTESKPSFKRGVRHPIALIQLATYRLACLFPVRPRCRPASALIDLLADSKVIKVAQGPSHEVGELREQLGVIVRGVVDIIPLARAAGSRKLSLRSLSAIYLQTRISKSAQTSNWAAPRLTARQKQYAATDAWVCREIYQKLMYPEVGVQ